MAKPNTPKLERPPRRYKGKTDDIVEDKRLQELRKQKALIEGHLQWIDSEIASLQTAATAPIRAHQSSNNRREGLESQAATNPVTLPTLSAEPGVEPDPNAAVSDIYDELGPDTRDSVNEARRGCITIFACAFLALGLLSLWIWYTY